MKKKKEGEGSKLCQRSCLEIFNFRIVMLYLITWFIDWLNPSGI